MQQQQDDDPAAAASTSSTDYSEVMSSILMEVLTLMSGGKFPPGVKKKEHVRSMRSDRFSIATADFEIVARQIGPSHHRNGQILRLSHIDTTQSHHY